MEEAVAYFPGELVGQWSSFSVEDCFHCYTLRLERNFHYDVPFTDISLIVKCNLGPDLARTSFQMEVGRGSVTVNLDYAGVIHLSDEQVHLARKFQAAVLRILIDRDLSNLENALYGLHPQNDKVSRVAYLLLPSVRNQESLIIDWESLRVTVGSLSLSTVLASSPRTGSGNEFRRCHRPDELCRCVQTKNAAVCSCIVNNALVFTPHNGCFYCTDGFMDGLDGNSILKLRKGRELQYKEYYKSRYGITLHFEKESLIKGRRIFTPQNCVRSRNFQKEKEPTNVVELPPELCAVIMAPVSIATWYSFSFVPSIMHRIEALLLAIHSRNLQMNHYTQNVIPATKIMEALTTKSCQEMFSLESLETFGDSFLKYAASQQLFRDHEDCREGFLTTKRMAMISNEALYALGSKRELQGFIRNGCFNPKHWTVPGDYSKYFSEEMFTTMSVYKMGTRNFGRDVVADVVEALIGAYLSTAGEQSALIFMEWLGMQINFVNKIPEDRPLLVKPEIHEKISYLESLLKYSFHDRSLLVEALTHGSFLSPEFPRFYQRLEFLGDSVLDYLITVHMYNTYPGLSPELLTDLRSASVNNDCYACVAVRSGLHRYIWHSSPTLDKQISSFVNSFEQTYSGAVHGWEASTFVPKVLGDVIESIAGAILIDSGFDKGIVWESMRPLLEPLITPDTVKYNPLKELKALRTERSYVVVVCPTMLDGIASVTIEVEANGVTYSKTETASNMKDAEKLAAKSVLKQLKASIPGL